MEILNNDLKYFVYKHIRLDKNETFYIGIGSYQPKWKYQRSKTTKNRNIHWKRIVNLSEGNFIVELIYDQITKEEAINKEIELIKLYGRSDLKLGTLCNLTDGGEGVNNLSEESKKKIGDSNRGEKSSMFGKHQTEQWKELMKERMSGKNNHNYGVPLPERQKEINRKAQLGRKHSAQRIELRVSKFRKRVINTLTNKIYESISDVSSEYGKAGSTITRWINKDIHNLKFL